MIEWTDQTLNPIRAHRDIGGPIAVGHHCEVVSPGCLNCYAQDQNLHSRFGALSGTRLPYVRSSRDRVEIVLDEKVLERLRRLRKPRRIFVGSMTDLFGEWVPDAMLLEVLVACAVAGRRGATIQLLTKRPVRMAEVFHAHRDLAHPNLWLGVSVETQRELHRAQTLGLIEGVTRFVSYEPALGPLDLGAFAHAIDWLIIGGESGPKARPFNVAWGISALEQARGAGCAVFFKQLGSHPIGQSAPPLRGIGPRGEDWSGWVGLEYAKVREFPDRQVAAARAA